MKNISIINPFKLITQTLIRFYLVLFVIVVSGGLIAAVLILTSILTPQSDTDLFTNSAIPKASVFNQAVVTKLTSLHTSGTNPASTRPVTQLRNPFWE